MNPFVQATITARTLCDSLGWDKGDDQPMASKALRGLRVVIRDVYDAAEGQGRLAHIVALVDRAAGTDPHNTAALLLNGWYADAVRRGDLIRPA